MQFGNNFQKFNRFRKRKTDLSPELGDSDASLGTKSTCDKRINRALTLRNQGQHREAIRLLEVIAGNASPDSMQLATYELALLHSQLGNHIEADKYLSRLGFVFKLTNHVLCPLASTRPLKSLSPKNEPLKGRKLAPVVAFDNVLPPSLLQPLLTAFSTSSAFWLEHNYPTEEFFSYNVKKNGEFSLMKQVIDQITPLINNYFAEKKIALNSRSVEWWCHKRDESSGYAHQLHYDLDERALQIYKLENLNGKKGYTTASISAREREVGLRGELHPMVSAVLYLTEQTNAAPTLVTDQTLDADSVASEAWLCHPAKNRLLLFDGKLLHGVVPFLPNAGGSKTEQTKAPSPRITIMMGWWAKDFNSDTLDSLKSRQCSSGSHTLGPNMPMPSSSSGLFDRVSKEAANTMVWPSLFAPVELPEGSKMSPPLQSKAGLQHIPGPVWVPVQGSQGLQPEERVALQKKGPSSIESHSLKSVQPKNSDQQFISIADLMKLREAPCVGISDDEEEADDKPVKASHKKSKVAEGVQEYMSIEDLNKLRNAEPDVTSSLAGKKCTSSNVGIGSSSTTCSKSKQQIKKSIPLNSEIVFVGKWFLKSKSEIRDDVLGCS